MRCEKVKTIEEVDKGNKNLDDTKESVVKICRNDLDNFEGQSKVSTGWLNTDHDKKSFIHLNRNSIKNFMKRILKVKIWSHINFFVLPFYTTKLNLFMRNDSVTINKEKIDSDDKKAPKD